MLRLTQIDKNCVSSRKSKTFYLSHSKLYFFKWYRLRSHFSIRAKYLTLYKNSIDLIVTGEGPSLTIDWRLLKYIVLASAYLKALIDWMFLLYLWRIAESPNTGPKTVSGNGKRPIPNYSSRRNKVLNDDDNYIHII